MAIRFDTSGESLSRTSNLPSISTCTVMGWVYISSATATTSFFSFGEAATSNRYTIGLWSDASSLVNWNGSAVATGSTVSASTWYHIAMVIDNASSLTCVVYLNGISDITNDTSGFSAEKLWFGNNESDELHNGRLAAVKVWSAVLTGDEIINEMKHYLPQRLANINGWYPSVSQAVNDNATDYSGNGNTMTVNGTLSVEDGPPIAWYPFRFKYRKTTPVVVSFTPKRRLLGVG